MWRPPPASELRERVRFERRATSSDGYGNQRGSWATLVTDRMVSIRSARGGETVIAARLTGTGLWDLTIRRDSGTATVTTDHRVADARDATRVWNIRWIGDLEGKGRWINMLLESGVADG